MANVNTTVTETSPGIRVRVRGSAVGHPLLGALSPSRAGDFMQCPLLYRFRTVDRLPERPSLAAFRGTLVHEVLDRLFDMPATDRTLDRAQTLAGQALQDLLDDEPEGAFALVDAAPWPGEIPAIPQDAVSSLLTAAAKLLGNYFEVEDPQRIEPMERECLVETELEPGFVLRGYVDRLDDHAGGLRVVDYKTGRSPGITGEQSALFQLRFYALIVHLSTGRLPQRLQLIYLGNREVLTYEPDAEDMRRFERKVRALWAAIARAAEKQDWRPNPSSKCRWCSHQQLCPAFGGQPPVLPEPARRASLTVEA